MASFLYSLVTGAEQDSRIDIASRTSAMRAMVEEYVAYLPTHCPAAGPVKNEGSVVLVTGTTGGLGTYLLSELVQNQDVFRIYAINRPRSNDTRTVDERQRKALKERGLDAEVLLTSGKVNLIEGNTALPRLGLEASVYDEVQIFVLLVES